MLVLMMVYPFLPDGYDRLAVGISLLAHRQLSGCHLGSVYSACGYTSSGELSQD